MSLPAYTVRSQEHRFVPYTHFERRSRGEKAETCRERFALCRLEVTGKQPIALRQGVQFAFCEGHPGDIRRTRQTT